MSSVVDRRSVLEFIIKSVTVLVCAVMLLVVAVALDVIPGYVGTPEELVLYDHDSGVEDNPGLPLPGVGFPPPIVDHITIRGDGSTTQMIQLSKGIYGLEIRHKEFGIGDESELAINHTPELPSDDSAFMTVEASTEWLQAQDFQLFPKILVDAEGNIRIEIDEK